jgi:hypothetical protein
MRTRTPGDDHQTKENWQGTRSNVIPKFCEPMKSHVFRHVFPVDQTDKAFVDYYTIGQIFEIETPAQEVKENSFPLAVEMHNYNPVFLGSPTYDYPKEKKATETAAIHDRQDSDSLQSFNSYSTASSSCTASSPTPTFRSQSLKEVFSRLFNSHCYCLRYRRQTKRRRENLTLPDF